MSWGLGDTNVDPGEVLLRLVTQSAARAERYAMLLEEAYEAAERLKQAHDAGAQIEAPGDELADTAETARRDLDRIFNTGGVAALVGNTYGAAKDVGVYVNGEVIRGLADLEAKERERCANFATKAIAAGLAERTVRVAERQGQLMVVDRVSSGRPVAARLCRFAKGSAGWRWFKQHCEKLIFHLSRHRRSKRRWLVRLGS
jgi:hypothetical protein